MLPPREMCAREMEVEGRRLGGEVVRWQGRRLFPASYHPRRRGEQLRRDRHCVWYHGELLLQWSAFEGRFKDLVLASAAAPVASERCLTAFTTSTFPTLPPPVFTLVAEQDKSDATARSHAPPAPPGQIETQRRRHAVFVLSYRTALIIPFQSWRRPDGLAAPTYYRHHTH